MPTDKPRREAARRHLERQLERRQERDAARKKFTLIASIVGTLVVIAVVVMVIVMAGNEHKKTPTAASSPSASTTSPAAIDTPTPAPSKSYAPAKGASVTFNGVTVTGAADLAGVPTVTSKGTTNPAKIEYKDLVIGTSTTATPTSNVTVQYVGVLYKGGKTPFDSSWGRGVPATFALTGVVPGFTQGIGGTTGVPAMKVGGRRLIIMPSALGYGAAGRPPTIPANSPLVFVVDLTSVG
ncbi:MAG: FKBP-type peptidyl-prolyl cis-trans isomerase [Jatrophihabitantaceae bacterium]